jgi:hypothetical protein
MPCDGEGDESRRSGSGEGLAGGVVVAVVVVFGMAAAGVVLDDAGGRLPAFDSSAPPLVELPISCERVLPEGE